MIENFGFIRADARFIPLRDESVHCCVTSPPYWGLRKYVVKGPQLGLEKTFEEYVAKMVEVLREVKRILRKDGTLWLNLGDSYGSGRKTDHALGKQGFSKQLIGIPWRVAFSLQADGWYLRSDIIWSKPNPMPESVEDRPTKAHEYIFLFSKSQKYYFDAEAVKESSITHAVEHRGIGISNKRKDLRSDIESRHRSSIQGGQSMQAEPNGQRNIRTVWTIATQPYPEAHFATFPEELPERCIKAGTSEKGCCPKCGKPWVRVVSRNTNSRMVEPSEIDRFGTGEAGIHRKVGGQYQKWLDANPKKTIGWKPSCSCGQEPVPCVVFDPFIGSGTVGRVSEELGRRWVGLDLGYGKLVKNRILGITGKGLLEDLF